MAVSVAPTNLIPGGNGKGPLEKKSHTIKGIDINRILPLLDHTDSQKHIASFEKKSYELVERALETLKQKIVDQKGIDDFLQSVVDDLNLEKFARLVDILKLGVNKDDAAQFLQYLKSVITYYDDVKKIGFPYHRSDITIEFLEKPLFAGFLNNQVATHFLRSEPYLTKAFIETLGREIGKELYGIMGQAAKEKNNEDVQLEFHTLYVLNLLVTDYAERYKKVQEMKAAALEESEQAGAAALRKGNGHAGSP